MCEYRRFWGIAFLVVLACSDLLANSPPTVSGVAPNSGTGTTQMFSFTFSDPDGAGDLSAIEVLVNAANSAYSACYLHYDPSTFKIFLATNGNWSNAQTLGSSNTLSNPQCTLDTASSSAVPAGNNLTLNLALTFKAFVGTQKIFAQAQDSFSNTSGWQQPGTWTVPNVAPTADSVSPNTGSGGSATFLFTFSDANGAQDLNFEEILINDVQNALNSCYLHIEYGHFIWLARDDLSGWDGPYDIQYHYGILQNSQCQLDLSNALSNQGSTALSITLKIDFSPSFAGARKVYLFAKDNAGATSGWLQRGTWTVPSGGNSVPAAVLVSPNSGTGSTQTFSFLYADANGATDLEWVEVLVNSALSATQSCFVHYVRSSGQVWLAADTPTSWIGPQSLGSNGNLTNSQCLLNLQSSSAGIAGNNLTLNLAITFQPLFAGSRFIYMRAKDLQGSTSPWFGAGTWNVTNSGNQPPSSLAVGPASGSGANRVFTFTVSDPNGYADLDRVEILINNQQTAIGGCLLHYWRAFNLIYLASDNAQSWIGPKNVGTGSNDFLQNSQCYVWLRTSQVTSAGSDLTLTLEFAFPATFSGARNIYMWAKDISGSIRGWQAVGNWTVNSSGNHPPGVVSVVPNSGGGVQQTFVYTFSDPDGFANLQAGELLINSGLFGGNACYLHYRPASNSLFLAADDAQSWSGPMTVGVAGTLQNSQCAISLGASSVSSSSNNVTLSVNVSFKPGFQGNRLVYALARDNSLMISGWQQLGTWTVP
jgi:hypothetical protein